MPLRAVQGYLASIAFCDEQIGRVLDALDGSPYAGNTIIVFWTDHGWHLGEKKHWRKFALWEEATRVPLMITAPGVTKPNTRCARTVSLLDLYPTFVDLCNRTGVTRLKEWSTTPDEYRAALLDMFDLGMREHLAFGKPVDFHTTFSADCVVAGGVSRICWFHQG